jgi:hypothetical protein
MSQGENFEVQRARERMDSRTIWNSEMTTHRIGGKPIRECQKHQSLQPVLVFQQAQERKLPPH